MCVACQPDIVLIKLRNEFARGVGDADVSAATTFPDAGKKNQ